MAVSTTMNRPCIHAARSQSVVQPISAHQRLIRTRAGTNGASATSTAGQAAASKYGWHFDSPNPTPAGLMQQPDQAQPVMDRKRRMIKDLPVASIKRPLGQTRANDQEKVAALMESISEIGLQEPIDVLEVDGQIYGFSGCHRYEAHVKLGLETIRCRVRKATKEVLKMHMM